MGTHEREQSQEARTGRHRSIRGWRARSASATIVSVTNPSRWTMAAIGGLVSGLAACDKGEQPSPEPAATSKPAADQPTASATTAPEPTAAASQKSATDCCAGKNACKGKGGCQTSKHACAGKNACKGQGGCSHRDCG